MMNATEKMDEVRRKLLEIACVPEPTSWIWNETYAKRLARHRERKLHVEQYSDELGEVELVCAGRQNVHSITKQQYNKMHCAATVDFNGEYIKILAVKNPNGGHSYAVYFRPISAL